MNLRNKVIPRLSGNNQASSAENVNEYQAVLPVGDETSGHSAHQEPNLTQALRQMTRVQQILDQNSHQSTAQLDVVLAAIMATNKNIARIRQLLARNEQTYGDP